MRRGQKEGEGVRGNRKREGEGVRGGHRKGEQRGRGTERERQIDRQTNRTKRCSGVFMSISEQSLYMYNIYISHICTAYNSHYYVLIIHYMAVSKR